MDAPPKRRINSSSSETKNRDEPGTVAWPDDPAGAQAAGFGAPAAAYGAQDAGYGAQSPAPGTSVERAAAAQARRSASS